MNVQVVGCSHHGTSIEMRERLAFSPEQTREALDHWRRVFPGVEAVLLSTCNRVEFFVATENTEPPTFEQIAQFLARFHDVDPTEVMEAIFHHSGEAAVEAAGAGPPFPEAAGSARPRASPIAIDASARSGAASRSIQRLAE